MTSASAPSLTVWVGASAGGHTNQLMALLAHSQAWPCEPVGCVTTLPIVRSEFENYAPTHVIGECHRGRPLAAVAALWRSFRVVARARPDVLVTTGSLPLALTAIWVKLFRGRVVWIDSVAQVDGMSMSGRLVRLFADLTLVQWPEIADADPRLEFAGQLL